MALSLSISGVGAISSATGGPIGRLSFSRSRFSSRSFAEVIANDKPILVSYRGEIFAPVAKFYPETAFGGDFKTEADYKDPVVQCLIATGGVEGCFDEPEEIIDAVAAGTYAEDGFEKGWALWPLIPYSFDTPVNQPGAAPLPPSSHNWLGTDDRKRDVVARVIYGFRLSILFTLIVTTLASVIGIIAGAIQAISAVGSTLFFSA